MLCHWAGCGAAGLSCPCGRVQGISRTRPQVIEVKGRFPA